MTFAKVYFNASKPQLSKLRNGRKVRIKPAMKGEGFCMIVKPQTYNQVARAFGKGKGVELSLTPEELLANSQSTGEMEGKGIFQDIGKAFKVAGKVAKPMMKQMVKGALPMLSQAGDQILDMGAEYAPQLLGSALSAGAIALGQPQLVPGALALGNMAGKELGKAGKKALKKEKDKLISRADRELGGSRPAGRVSNAGGTSGRREVYDAPSVNELGAMMGSNYGYMGRAGTGASDYLQLQALADQARQRQMNAPTSIGGMDRGHYNSNMIGNRGSMRWIGGTGEGLYAGKQDGRGFTAGSGFKASGGQLGGKGASVLPPALQSQPYSANFQFQHTLPPAYQRYSKSGQGIYARA
mgnify:FL=1